MRASLCLLVVTCSAAAALERGSYDSTGRLVALLSDNDFIEMTSGLVAVQPTGKRLLLQARRPGLELRRQRGELAWSGTFELPDGGRGSFDLKANETAEGIAYVTSVKAQTALQLSALEMVFDLPRAEFINAQLSVGGRRVPLSAMRQSAAPLFDGEAGSLEISGGVVPRTLKMRFGKALPVTVVDHWEERGRSWQVRVAIARGALPAESSVEATTELALSGRPAEQQAVLLSVDTAKPRYRFDGFGGNYCWDNRSPDTAYTLENLKLGWARTEMKLLAWDKERGNPGPEIRRDFELWQHFVKNGVPFVASIWWLPERFYTDPHQQTRSGRFRRIDPEKWPEVLEFITSYILYAKQHYGAEPDLFSFNEANIGIYVGFNPEDHADALKRFGSYFEKAGLKTRMLLGDATGPRDTHKYVLAAAADPEAMKYVTAVGFHSWGGATPEQYAAWGDVAEWLGLPLLVTELGVDAASYHARSWDSYFYGLREARMTQEIMTYARPQGTQFWEFTNDYSLVHRRPDGSVEPTARLFLVKHFTDLTPHKSEALSTASSEPEVLFTAFRSGNQYTLHILNLGPAREVSITGLPAAEWQATQTTEQEHYKQRAAGRSAGGSLRITVPVRSLVTLQAVGRTMTSKAN